MLKLLGYEYGLSKKMNGHPQSPSVMSRGEQGVSYVLAGSPPAARNTQLMISTNASS